MPESDPLEELLQGTDPEPPPIPEPPRMREPVAEPTSQPQTGKVRVTATIDNELYQRVQALRDAGTAINVSRILEEAVLREVDQLSNPDRPRRHLIIERLRAERDERMDLDWVAGHKIGAAWASRIAAWREIKHYAALDPSSVVVGELYSTDGRQYFVFEGEFEAPERDYGRDQPGIAGAPGFKEPNVGSDAPWVWNVFRQVSYWRGWLAGVKEVHDEVADELDDEIPF